MMALPRSGFVLLSMPKCASTSLERTLGGKAEIVLRYHPKLKHMSCRQFERKMVPVLKGAGYGRDDYEVVSMFREPIAWLESWFRYRSRPDIAEDQRRRKWTGELGFEEFAERYMAGDRRGPVVKGRPAMFVARDQSTREIGVDRIFALEQPDAWQSWFAGRTGVEFRERTLNQSTHRERPEISTALRARLEAHFAPEYDIYEHLRGTGQWAPPRGYVPAGWARG